MDRAWIEGLRESKKEGRKEREHGQTLVIALLGESKGGREKEGEIVDMYFDRPELLFLFLKRNDRCLGTF
jgi:hypothetical protein